MKSQNLAIAALLFSSAAFSAPELYQSRGTDFPANNQFSFPSLDLNTVESVKVWVDEEDPYNAKITKLVLDMKNATDLVINNWDNYGPDHSANVNSAWIYRNLKATAQLEGLGYGTTRVNLKIDVLPEKFNTDYPQAVTILETNTEIEFAGQNPIADVTSVQINGKKLTLRLKEKSVSEDGNAGFSVDARWLGYGQKDIFIHSPIHNSKAVSLKLTELEYPSPDLDKDYDVTLKVEDMHGYVSEHPVGTLSQILYSNFQIDPAF